MRNLRLKGTVGMILCVVMIFSVGFSAMADVTFVSDPAALGTGTSTNPRLWNMNTSPYSAASDNKFGGAKTLAAPAERVFATNRSNTVSFVLLNSANADSNDGYFVMRQRSIAMQNTDGSTPVSRKFWDESRADTGTAASEYAYNYDPNDKRSIAYDINQESFLDTGDQATASNLTAGPIVMPTEIRTFVNEHTWWQENTPNMSGETMKLRDAFSVKCKYNLLSFTEYIRNKQYISVGNSRTDDNPWTASSPIMLRTPGRVAKGAYAWIGDTAPYVSGTSMSTYAKRAVRICFYLKPEFFSSVKLNVATLGADVKKVILKECSLEQAIALGYTDDELKAIGYELKTDITKSESNGKYIFTVKTTNFSDTSKNVDVFVAAYNGDELIGVVKAATATVTAGNYSDIVLPEYDLSSYDTSNIKIRTFVWDTDLAPYTAAPLTELSAISDTNA